MFFTSTTRHCLCHLPSKFGSHLIQVILCEVVEELNCPWSGSQSYDMYHLRHVAARIGSEQNPAVQFDFTPPGPTGDKSSSDPAAADDDDGGRKKKVPCQ